MSLSLHPIHSSLFPVPHSEIIVNGLVMREGGIISESCDENR